MAYVDLRHEEGWAVDPDRIATLMTPRTRLVSLTKPNNPTGAVIHETTIRVVVEMFDAQRTTHPLIDESHRGLT